MADEYNNKNDEVVDSIPENTRNINESNIPSAEQRGSYSQQNNAQNNGSTIYAESSLLSIVCLGLGIFSVICCCTVVPAGISSIIGLIVGIFALKNNSANKTAAAVGIILCCIGLAIFLLYGAFMIIFGSLGAIFNMPAAIQPKAM